MSEQDQPDFPRYYYSKDEQQNRVKDSGTGEDLCGSRLFDSQEALDAAGGSGQWYRTPQEAAQAGQQSPQAGQQQAQAAHMAGQQSTQTGQQDPPRQEPPPGTPPPDEAPSSTTRRR